MSSRKYTRYKMSPGGDLLHQTKYHSFTRKSLRLNRPFCQSGGRRLSKLISEMGGGGFNWGWQLGFGRFKGMFVWVGKAPLSSIIQPGVRLNCPKNTHISDQWSFGESQEGGPNDNHIQQGLNDSLRVSPLVSISISGPLSCGFIPGGLTNMWWLWWTATVGVATFFSASLNLMDNMVYPNNPVDW